MPDLTTQIRDPCEGSTGGEGYEDIEGSQATRQGPPFPAARQYEQRHSAGDPSHDQPDQPSLLVTLEVGLSSADPGLDSLFRTLPRPKRGAGCQPGYHQHAEGGLLHDAIPAKPPKSEQHCSKRDPEDRQVSDDEMQMGAVHTDQAGGRPAA